MLKFHKGPIVLLSLALMLFGTAACRPTPGDPVEYLHREDTILIQMLSLVAGVSEIDRALAVPEFTLYGDGTLIYKHETADGTRLLQALLPEDAVRELLEDIVDGGFLDFTYDQPAPKGASGDTTFLYAHTLDRANAVSVRGVSAPLPEDALNEFDQYRKIQTFVEMLRTLDPVELGSSEPLDFVPNALLLHIMHIGEPVRIGTPPLPATSEIDFAEILPIDSGPVLHQVEGDIATSLWRQFGVVGHGVTPLQGPLQQGDQTYLITFVPLLPYYENFPEFDLQ